MKRALPLLLASSAAGALLKGSFLSRSSSESQALQAQSQDLDRALQSYAEQQAPGTTRDFLKTLRLCAPCNAFERFGEPNDGGYVMCADGLDKGLVGAYSYGINGFDGWGMAVASRYHVPLHEYDCTNSKQPKVCSGCDVHFHDECILGNDSKVPTWFNGEPRGSYKTFTQQFKDSGNSNAKERSLLLKIDVEAAEWSVFAEEPVENLKKFREIVVEYHWISEAHGHDLYLQAVKKIELAGFSVTHLHGNNFGGGLQSFGKYKIPNVLEVTYIQTPASGCAANIPYHVPQDMPNNRNSGELGEAVLPSKL